MAVVNYHDTEGHYPPAFRAAEDNGPEVSWRVRVLPYIEADRLHKQYNVGEFWDGPTNSQLAGQMPRSYALHGDYKSGLTATNYLAIVGPNTAWRPGKAVNEKDVKDGRSQTLLIVENRGLGVHWMEPRDLDFGSMDWTINSPNGVSSKYDAPAAALLDGSVARLSPRTPPEALRALATIDGGEELSQGQDGWRVIPDGRLRPVTNP